jgi:Pentapeptide repeats (8 copies)
MEHEKERKPKRWRRRGPTSPAKKRFWHRWPWTGWRGRTLWDWQTVLIVPLAVVALASLFTVVQAGRQRAIENQRAGAEMLQTYLDQMGPMLLEKHLRTTEDVDVQNLARARTLTTLDALDPERKRRVLRFLTETELINARLPEGQSLVSACPQDKLPVIPSERQPAVSLKYARLGGVKIGRHGLLGGIDLQQADLANADISDADLSNTSLRGANLFEAHLSSTDLSKVDLRGACLSGAYLSGANLRRANLSGAQGVTRDRLVQQAASLEGATMPDGQKYED